MIRKLTFATVYVLNQASAYDFYVNKLGFKVHTDAPIGKDNRWLTVTPQTNLKLKFHYYLCGGRYVYERNC